MRVCRADGGRRSHWLGTSAAERKSVLRGGCREAVEKLLDELPHQSRLAEAIAEMFEIRAFREVEFQIAEWQGTPSHLRFISEVYYELSGSACLFHYHSELT
jgi:hypothetical protein